MNSDQIRGTFYSCVGLIIILTTSSVIGAVLMAGGLCLIFVASTEE